MTRVLIVEDSIVSSMMMEATIHRKKPDCEVRIRRSMKGAMEEIALYRPNIILLDLDLPDSGPDESCQQITPIKQATGACVVAMTGHDGYESKARACGADDFLEKAIGEAASPLIDRINRLIPKCSDPLEKS